MIAAVLAVFLVAVLFMGAASAAPAAGDVVYVYQFGIGAPGDTYYLWVSGAPAGSVTLDSTGTLTGEGITEGIYATTTAGTTLFSVKYPAITLNGYLAGTGTSIEGKSLLKSQSIDFAVSGNNKLQYGLSFTTPAGGTTNTFGNVGGVPCVFADSAALGFTLTGIAINDVESGTWSAVSKLLTTTTTAAVTTKMIDTTPSKYLSSAKLTFTVGSTITDSITISTEKAVRGSSTLLTIAGTPSSYVPVTVNAAGLILHAGQSGVIYTPSAAELAAGITAPTVDPVTGYVSDFWVKLSNSGTRTVQLDSNSNSDAKSYTITAKFSLALTDLFVPILGSDKNVKFTLEKGVVTLTSGQESYYLGNDITLSGTNTESDQIYLFIKGSNVERTFVSLIAVNPDNTWTTTFDPRVVYGPLDAGTYTFYASADADTTGLVPVFDSQYAYSTASVALKQPFLTATAASSTVAQGDKIKISGTAEATNDLQYYVFGTNKFVTNVISVDSDGTYSAEIETDDLAAGQYFVVVQHPMYDGVFNVGPFAQTTTLAGVVTNYAIIYNSQGAAAAATINPVTVVGGNTILFYTQDRQSSNAAEALCQQLDNQNIDDIYVKLTFIVAQPTLTMNPVSDVAKGSALKVSGTTNLKEGTVVTVDVLSTAFTAVDKTSVNSASFITLTTKAVKGADGANTWEVTFDTTGLNVDSYTVQAMTENLQTSTIIKITEAKPTATATATATKTATATATATATPTKTPGFGAFLALAGLGAVAVLVLRRD